MIVVVFVNFAPSVMTFVVVVNPKRSFVLVGVGKVVVCVRSPERTVGGGTVNVEVAVSSTDSVVVIAGAIIVVVTLTGLVAVKVVVGASGARRCRSPAARASRFSLAASIRARAHSKSTLRSPLRTKRWSLGIVVGVTKAAG